MTTYGLKWILAGLLVLFPTCRTPSTCHWVWGDSKTINWQVALQDVIVHDFIDDIMSRGRGMLMVKFNVATAHRNVAVYPNDRHLLGMRWRDSYYVDVVLPFRLQFATNYLLFPPISDRVKWTPTIVMEDFLTLLNGSSGLYLLRTF